ncbi:MAG: hypothetical protein MZW92_64085 [Comamonadaceae bacterium]|nr:hypothetical protein [Comamonadaceae bacterium]
MAALGRLCAHDRVRRHGADRPVSVVTNSLRLQRLTTMPSDRCRTLAGRTRRARRSTTGAHGAP